LWYNLRVRNKNKKMNKKLPIQLAVGIIIIVALIVGGSFYFINKKVDKIENGNVKREHVKPGEKLFGLGGGYAYFGKDAFYKGKKMDGVDGSELENLGDGYAKDKSNVLYNGKKIDGVDGSELKSLGYSYAKNKSNVFYQGNILEGADVKTFREYEKDSSIFVDKNQAYRGGKTMTLSEAEELNNFLTKDIGGIDLGNYYRLFKGIVYYWSSGPHAVPNMAPLDVEPSEFKTFNNKYCTNKPNPSKFNTCERYGKDRNKVFLGYHEIEGADPSSFVLLGKDYGLQGRYSKDKSSVFFETSKLQDADPNSFNILDGGYSKDDANVYYCEDKIIGVDPETFLILESDGQIAKDKDAFFRRGKKIDPSKYELFKIDKYLK